MTDYYDLVLGLIPVTTALVATVLVGTGVSIPVAVSAGSLASVGIMGHAMFVRSPGGNRSTRAAGPAGDPSDSPARSTQPINSAD